MTRIIVKDDQNDLAKEAARIFTASAVACSSEKRRFAVALSGGSTPRLMHKLLAEEPYLSEIPWENTHIFWSDDRYVPEYHPLSNFGTAKNDFIDKVPISGSHVYPMRAESSHDKDAIRYQRILSDFFKLEVGKFPRFDLLFLGMGADGHTASLFPGHRALDETKKLVVSVKGGNPDVYRLTMTMPVLNNAGKVVFLISGRQKAGAIKSVFERNDILMPAKRVQPINGELIWLIDREAASLLDKA